MRKKNTDYFNSFMQLVNYSSLAAAHLHGVLSDYAPEKLPARLEEIHEIEHSADMEKHIVMKRLAREFITPIERGDIITLMNEIDNVTDSIEDTELKLYTYNISDIRREAVSMSEIIIACCDVLSSAVAEFRNFRRSEKLQPFLTEVKNLEENADKVYTAAVRRLYTERSGPHELAGWTRIFEKLEKCCDTCAHVSDMIEVIALKNS